MSLELLGSPLGNFSMDVFTHNCTANGRQDFLAGNVMYKLNFLQSYSIAILDD